MQQTFYRWKYLLVLAARMAYATHRAAAVAAVTACSNIAYQINVVKSALDSASVPGYTTAPLFLAPGYCTDLGVFYTLTQYADWQLPHAQPIPFAKVEKCQRLCADFQRHHGGFLATIFS